MKGQASLPCHWQLLLVVGMSMTLLAMLILLPTLEEDMKRSQPQLLAPWQLRGVGALGEVEAQIAPTVTTEPVVRLLSRELKTKATCDTRGNLGPCEVMLNTGTNWLKDRWQAASDMGGTAIPGAHWVVLEFSQSVAAKKIVLDWEAAYADCYRLEGRQEWGEDDEGWETLFDSTKTGKPFKPASAKRSVVQTGQSPGVKFKMPLHVIHTIDLPTTQITFKYLRLYIARPGHGWGVSLWQFNVWGWLA
eukprot:TRINITY_DN121229_c0_g1_i1.p1 TRINITY_DN121229_c0_g1~~TRINITY_DN121229_c0_g1_i1.p1  ORF type:complete len:248 (+),score=35.24 TRINITY_DN121229_c0_g1_i1:84-827(+)